MTAIGLIALCALVGLAADTGYFFENRRRAQTAADAAALAGAEQLRRAGTTRVVTAANDAAAANGFTNGVSGTTIAVHNPPSSGYYTADTSYVEAIVTQDRPTLFMGLLGLQSARASARAVAGVQDSQNCVYTLSQTGAGLTLGGSKATVSAACGIVVDSSASNALNAGAGSVFATSVSVTGSISGSCNTQDPAGCRTGVPPQPDPLATQADPQFSGCDFGGSPPVRINGGVVTLTPGVYCNGISITAGATVTFAPGVYILNGGGLSVQGNSTIQGTGVTFYNTARGSYNFAPVNIAGGTLGFLLAPTSGPMDGMLFFQDRTIVPQSGKNTNVFAGSSNLNFAGTFYFPTTALTFTGGGQVSINYAVLVASSIAVSGNTILSGNFSSLPDGNPVKKVTLAE
jgi:Flp pilus assembly protein TadG